ncbi:MAG: STAS domain-containing protein [Thermodesulfobacteriota bacterium]
MMAQRLTIEQDAAGVFLLAGPMTAEHLDYLRLFLEDDLGRAQRIALDLGGVTAVDALAVQLLIAFRRTLPPNRDWQITRLSPELEDILVKTGLRQLLCP